MNGIKLETSLRARSVLGYRRAIRTATPPILRKASSTTENASHVCDVCIVGGGIVGTALASALSTSSLKVALIEAGNLFQIPENNGNTYSNRVSSLTGSTIRFLKQIDAWNAIEANRSTPYRTMQVWDAIGKGKIQFNAPPGEEAIAHIVENNHLQAALVSTLTASQQTKIFNQSKVNSIVSGPLKHGGYGWPVVRLEDGRTIQSRLLSFAKVGADGANSRVRTFAEIDSNGWDYAQMGLVATLRLVPTDKGNDTAWQRFLPSGPIALLPLDNEHSSLVWSIPPKLAPLLRSLPEREFAEIVNVAFTGSWPDLQFLTSQIGDDGSASANFVEEARWSRKRAAIGEPKPPTIVGVQHKSRASFPLRLRNSESYAKSRVALIGDAAHSVHPLAGQGLNLGIADAESLAEVIKEGIEVGQDLGHIHLLENYTRARFTSNLAMMKSIDSIGKLFGTENGPVVTLRSFGLDVTNSMGPIKDRIMNFAGRSII
ncbi:hypothetical protein PhCBS80983_g02152 [Powellomyces hirtus]|uniref:Ubiquinone biosynthesis monooxygenase COQ6, mitochondrial n=1 Tax=Powellomyces hirtus TaxID=109895 RepID=A0A507E936_9FUNG|nr:hypothetical protein PhCBS80983_g02152 [Powellomyces hirtus]